MKMVYLLVINHCVEWSGIFLQLNKSKLKNQLLAFICFLFAGNLLAQEYKFTIRNLTTEQGIANVQVFNADSLVFVSDARGQILVPNILLFKNFKLQKIGFEIRIIRLDAENLDQILYLVPSLEILSEVVVRSGVIPQSIQKSPASINIVNSADFNRTDATNILESFNNVPGVTVYQGALNTNKISIRGIGARSQYSTNRIQSCYDGIPIATAEGDLTLDDFDQESVERIEIIKGPTSSIYGAGLGGSINLFSKFF